jgi:enamine deaminase RidA (YjgF/YER057c/UK114 family)
MPTAVTSFASISNQRKMSTKTPVFTKDAPMPLPGIYNQAIVANGFVFCSGTVPMGTDNKIIDGDIQDHTVVLPFQIYSANS